MKMMTQEEAVAAIEDVLRRWVPGTFENGYAMAEWLKAKGVEVWNQTADAQSAE